MGKRGPQPQPADLKKLRGNPGKRPIKEVPLAPPGVPPCPDDLADVLADWNRYGKTLSDLGILRETDHVMYEALWRTWAKYKTLSVRREVLDDLVERVGDDDEADAGVIKSLFTLIAKIEPLELQYLAALVRLLDHFGMSPSSRSSLSVEPAKEKSDFDTFLEQGGKLRAVK